MKILPKLEFILRTAPSLSWWRQVAFVIKNRGKILVYRKMFSEIDKTASVTVVRGVLSMGKPWISGFHANNMLWMRPKSKIVVEESFIIYNNFNIILHEGAELHLGEGYINNGLNLECHKKIIIGKGVAIGPNVTIRDADSKKLLLNNIVINKESPVRIGDNVWIGEGAMILKGVNVGEGAIVAAGAIVCKDVEPHSLVAGIPAVAIKHKVLWSS